MKRMKRIKRKITKRIKTIDFPLKKSKKIEGIPKVENNFPTYWSIYAVNGHGRRIYLGLSEGKTPEIAKSRKTLEFSKFPRFLQEIADGKIVITVEKL